MSVPTWNRKITLARRPIGAAELDDFTLIEEPLREPADGEVAVRIELLSVDPYQRGRMNEGRSYTENLQLGDVIVAAAVGRVMASRSDRFSVGDHVLGYLGWQEYATVPGRALTRLAADHVPVSAYLGVLGLPGVTAWMGMELIGKPQPAETVVVSAAAGAVGGIAGQLAKAAGARVVGIAGGPAKRAFLLDGLGFDAAVDYRDPQFEHRLAEATPDGIDVYFENVGGAVARAALTRLNDFARVPLCGLIAEYDTAVATTWDLSTLLARRVRVEGFICTDQMKLWSRAVSELTDLYRAGRLRYRESFAHGLQAAPRTLLGLLRGENLGKQLVSLTPEAPVPTEDSR